MQSIVFMSYEAFLLEIQRLESNMVIAAVEIKLYLPWVHSLKENEWQ